MEILEPVRDLIIEMLRSRFDSWFSVISRTEGAATKIAIWDQRNDGDTMIGRIIINIDSGGIALHSYDKAEVRLQKTDLYNPNCFDIVEKWTDQLVERFL